MSCGPVDLSRAKLQAVGWLPQLKMVQYISVREKCVYFLKELLRTYLHSTYIL
jgi:hypothetical protein